MHTMLYVWYSQCLMLDAHPHTLVNYCCFACAPYIIIFCKKMSSCRLKGERRMNWSKWGRSWRRQKFIKICTWGKLPPRQELYLASGKNPPQEEHDEKCLVLHLSEGGWGMAVCHHKYAIEKYVTTNMQCYGMLPRVGGYLQGVFCSAFPFKIANVPNHCCDWDLNQHPKTPIFVELNSERKATDKFEPGGKIKMLHKNPVFLPLRFHFLVQKVGCLTINFLTLWRFQLSLTWFLQAVTFLDLWTYVCEIEKQKRPVWKKRTASKI